MSDKIIPQQEMHEWEVVFWRTNNGRIKRFVAIIASGSYDT